MTWIGPQFLDIVVFLATPGGEPGGTAFLVHVHADDSDGTAYLVTAKHNLEESKSDSVVVRFNEGSGATEIPTSREDWFVHDSADVAVLAATGDLARIPAASGKALPVDGFVSNALTFPTMHLSSATQIVGGETVQVGDEVFFTGLFSASAGKERNMPVARFGRLSRLAGEPVTLKRWGGTSAVKVHAHLVECLSWGGASGSPVFARRQTMTMLMARDGKPRGVHFDYVVGLLGLVTAHWDLRRRAAVQEAPGSGSPGDRGEEERALEAHFELNSGLAIVTPAQSIGELLYRDDVIAARS